ncbi:MAG: TlyA family RNA methyltransferase [bacterium]
MKKRLDMAAVERGFFPTRAKAQAAIMAGLVKVNGKPAEKAGQPVDEASAIEILSDACPYVSRGGIKLKAGLEAFGISPAGKICADIGAATGGFTDCLLKEGASKVYAVDVGKGQLDEGLKKDPRVVFIPETNARRLRPDIFSPQPSLAVIDVSFISLRLILAPLMKALAPEADVIALIKPQFELEPKKAPGGIVRSEEHRLQAIQSLRDFLPAFNSAPGRLGPPYGAPQKTGGLRHARGDRPAPPHFQALPLESAPKKLCVGVMPDASRLSVTESGLIPSPIKGAKGNVEYLWHLVKKAGR